MNLSTSVYAANRGYAWSNVPEGITLQWLNEACRTISESRGDFPDPLQIEVGIIADTRIAAAYTLQNVDKWDSAGRASDYFAFAFFPTGLARKFDFVSLISNDFFWTPSRTPPTQICYEGPNAADYAPGIATTLKANRRAVLDDPHAIGALLGDCGTLSDRWICRLHEGNQFSITCGPWIGQ